MTLNRFFEDKKIGEKSEMFIYMPLDKNGAPEKDSGDSSSDGKKQSRQSVVELDSSFEYVMDGKRYQIADYSHKSLTLKPDDAHYGLVGDCHYCHHYFLLPGSARKRERCSEGTNNDIYLGERKTIGAHSHSASEEKRVLRRLTSNPRFGELEKEMSRFIKQYLPPTNPPD